MMNKNGFIVLIIILLSFVSTLSAQPQKDSTEAYNYWAQRGIIEMVYAYMNDYVETVGEAKAKSEIVGRDKYKENYISEINNNELVSFETISSFLKSNSWGGTEKNLLQPLLKNYKENVELDSNFFSAKKPGSNDLITVIPGKNNNNTNWHKKKQEIINNYNNQLLVLPENGLQKEEFKKEKVTSVIEKKPKQVSSEHSKWMQWIIFLLVFILGVLIGGWLIYAISKNSIYSILASEKDKYLRDVKSSTESFIFKYVGLFFILKNSKDDYKSKFEQINNNNFKSNNQRAKIYKLEREISELKQKVSQSVTIPEELDLKPEIKNTYEWEIKQTETVTRKLFFSMPESNGRFIVDNGETSNDGRKYFKIEYNEGSETGEFYYISGDRDKRAINRLESYLKPACDIENIENADSATNIEFIKSGKVVLINDSWVIDSDNKVKIKLF